MENNIVKRIEFANKEKIQIVNDTSNCGYEWVTSVYFIHIDFSMWVYTDRLLRESFPDGPQPTHFLDTNNISLP